MAAIAMSCVATSADPVLGQQPPDTEARGPDAPLEVTVEGARLPTAGSRDRSSASFVIRRHELERPGVDLASVLRRVPGVQVAKTGSTADLSTASIRGTTSAQVPVYLAGVRLNDDVTGTADLSTVPVWMLDRVEVYRGNAPASADRLGLGGAIFLEPRLPRDDRFGAGVEVGSFGARRTWVAGAAGTRRASALVAISRSRAVNDYPFTDDGGTFFDPSDDREARRPNADFVDHDVWAIARQRLEGGTRVTAIVNGFSRDQGVSGLLVTPARRARAAVQRSLGALSVDVPCSSRRGDCTLGLSTSALASNHVLSDPSRELGLFTTEVASTGRRVVGEARLRIRPSDAFQLTAAAHRATETLALDRRGGASLRARRETLRALVAAAAHVDAPTELHGHAAVECHSTHGGTSTEACSVIEPSARAGIRQSLSDAVEVVANAGRYARVPTLGETFGTSAFVRGNPTLDAESGYTLDAGARLHAGEHGTVAVWLDAFGFARWVDDLVAYRRTSVGVVSPFNVGRARVVGIEMVQVTDVGRRLRSELSATVSDPRDTTEDRPLSNDVLPFQSRLVVSGRLEAYAEPAVRDWSLDRTSLGSVVTHRSSRFSDPAGLGVIEQQTTLDVDAATAWIGGRLAVRFAVLNVLDAEAFDSIGFPLPGRSYQASATGWWW